MQGDSLIFRSGRLNFEQSVPPLPSYLIREYLYLTIQYWIVRQSVMWEGSPCVASNHSSRTYFPISGKNFPNKWGICDAFLGCYSLLGYLLVAVWLSFGFQKKQNKQIVVNQC